MRASPDPETDRGLIRLIKLSGSFSLAVMAAILVSLEQVTPDLKFRFSVWTVLAFVLAMVFSWLFWTVVFQPDESPLSGSAPARNPRRRVVLFAVLSATLCLATLTAFGLSLKGVRNERIREILQGAALAVLALTFLGFVLWRIARFLNQDSRRASGTGKEPPETK